MKKNTVKIILDILMFLLLFLMYSKSVISMNFHEVGGLAVCGLFLIHKGLNWKWMVGVSKRLFDKSLPTKTRLGYIINILLFISMTFIAVSGIMISKTIFTRISSGGIFWKLGHFFAAAMAIVLTGIHIGLHWSFIKNMFAKVLKFPHAVTKPFGIICLAIILIYGGYSMTTSNFIRWLKSPFIVLTISKGEMPHKGERFEGSIRIKGGEKPENLVRSDGMLMKPKKFPRNSSLSLERALNVIVSYGSITAFFTALTLLIEKILKKVSYAVRL